jgi:RNA recognition motif-containing protein
MNSKLYVGNLAYSAKEEELNTIFAAFGDVVSVKIIIDKMTGKAKGFAFVEMEQDSDAAKAIESLNNKIVNGRPMKVCEDRGKGGASAAGGEAGEGSEGGGGGRRN